MYHGLITRERLLECHLREETGLTNLPVALGGRPHAFNFSVFSANRI